jgi:polyisoprenoid-binding protein YceI
MSTNPLTDQTAATRWQLDPSQSRVEFRVPHFWGLVKVRGHFDRFDGWLETHPQGPGQLELTIDAASVKTGIGKRDAHLRGADFFDAEHHPTIRFHAAVVTEHDGRLTVEGELQAAGKSVTLEISPTFERTGDQMQIELTTTVDQRQLGMTWSPLGMTRTPTTITVNARLLRGHLGPH